MRPLGIVIVLTLAAFLAACASSYPPSRVEADAHTSYENGFSVRFPGGWGRTERLPEPLPSLLPDLPGESEALVIAQPSTGGFIVVEAAWDEATWFAFQLSAPEARHHLTVSETIEAIAAEHPTSDVDQRLYWDHLDVTHSNWMMKNQGFQPEKMADFSYLVDIGTESKRIYGEAFAYPCRDGFVCRLTLCLISRPEHYPADLDAFRALSRSIRAYGE